MRLFRHICGAALQDQPNDGPRSCCHGLLGQIGVVRLSFTVSAPVIWIALRPRLLHGALVDPVAGIGLELGPLPFAYTGGLAARWGAEGLIGNLRARLKGFATTGAGSGNRGVAMRKLHEPHGGDSAHEGASQYLRPFAPNPPRRRLRLGEARVRPLVDFDQSCTQPVQDLVLTMCLPTRRDLAGAPWRAVHR